MARRRPPDVPSGRPTLLGLLADCKAHPDDGRRLILADWLEEHGDEADRARGELIRLQVAMTRGPGDGPEWMELFRQAAQLREKYQKTWLAPLKAIGEPSRAELHRGLVTLRIEPPALRSAAVFRAAATEAYAWVEGLSLPAAEGNTLRALGASPLLEGITSLGISGSAERGLPALLRSPRLGQLQVLDLSGLRIGDAGAIALAACERLAGLRELRLEGCDIQPTGLRALAASAHLRELRLLNLAHNPLGRMEPLAQSQAFPRLLWLSLEEATVDEFGAAALADGPLLASVERLNLSHTPMGAEGVSALARSPHLEHLVSLGLGGVEIGWGINALATAALPALESLSLASTSMDGRMLRTLVGNDSLTRLSNLDLRANPLRGRGATALAQAPWPLTRLNLVETQLGVEGARRLAQWKGLEGLRILLLRGNAIGSRGGRTLAASKTMGSLTNLDLDNNQLDDAAVFALAHAPWMAEVVWLSLRYNTIGDPGVHALLSSPYLENVRSLHLFGPENTYGAASRAALEERFGKALAMY